MTELQVSKPVVGLDVCKCYFIGDSVLQTGAENEYTKRFKVSPDGKLIVFQGRYGNIHLVFRFDKPSVLKRNVATVRKCSGDCCIVMLLRRHNIGIRIIFLQIFISITHLCNESLCRYMNEC